MLKVLHETFFCIFFRDGATSNTPYDFLVTGNRSEASEDQGWEITRLYPIVTCYSCDTSPRRERTGDARQRAERSVSCGGQALESWAGPPRGGGELTAPEEKEKA